MIKKKSQILNKLKQLVREDDDRKKQALRRDIAKIIEDEPSTQGRKRLLAYHREQYRKLIKENIKKSLRN